VNRRFGATYLHHFQGKNSAEQQTGMQREAKQNPALRYILLDGNIHSYRSENLRSFTFIPPAH
jgi:hypothetical protein